MRISDNGAAILVSCFGPVWALAPDRFAALTHTVDQRRKSPRASAISRAVAGLPTRQQGTMILRIRGVIVQHGAGDLDGLFGWTSTDQVGRHIDDGIDRPDVGQIILDLDSPGGVVYGVPELAAKIRAFRNTKPIYAVANSEAGSAAYWIGSAASKFYVTPSGQVGSIGVWSAHRDVSQLEERAGIKTTLVHAGEHKIEGHPWAPLGDEARAEMQRSVDHYHDAFLRDVAAGRRKAVPTVRTQFGRGRMVRPYEAHAAGMVDGIATLDEVLLGKASGLAFGPGARILPPRLRTATGLISIVEAEL